MFRISLNRVRERVEVREGDERLLLRVDNSASRLMAGLNEAQRRMSGLNDESTREKQEDAARYFAGVLFGEEQAARLMEFYANDAACVITVCGRLFSERLAKKIAKAQKREK